MKFKIIEYVMNWKIGSNLFRKVYNPLLSGVISLKRIFYLKKMNFVGKVTKIYDYLKSYGYVRFI